jgi:putative hydrolase of the HAD superfamily
MTFAAARAKVHNTPMIDVIAFDADDTLWYTESLYVMIQERFKQILAPYDLDGDIDARLYETEMRNLNTFGYGAKGFTLSMIETAIEMTDGRVRGGDIKQIIDAVRAMMRKEIRLLDHVAETIPALAGERILMVITKGDLLEQESKIARSGLADYFRFVEIVSHKDEEAYRRVLEKNNVDLGRFLMVGNSMPSDILPILALGALAAHIPHDVTWAHEQAALDNVPDGYFKLDHVGQVPELIARLESQL